MIAESGCWEWIGSKYSSGYGQTSINNKKFTAHRISYELFIGDYIKGMDICHSCDNPSCVSPFHLFLGTRLENMQDMVAKGRGRKMGQHPSVAHYQKGCRCDICIKLNKEYHDEYRLKNKERLVTAKKIYDKKYSQDLRNKKRLSLL